MTILEFPKKQKPEEEPGEVWYHACVDCGSCLWYIKTNCFECSECGNQMDYVGDKVE